MPDNPPEPNFRNDPLYAQGMAHLQGGHWNDAVAAFEALSRKYGADPELARALEQARFKAQLDTLGRVRPRQITFPWRAWLARGVIVVLIAVLAVYGAGLLSERVAPAIARAQEDQQRANLVMQATSLVESENYDEAENKINELEQVDPSNAALPELRGKLAGGQEIKRLYDAAVAAQAAGDADEALKRLSDLSVRRPNYRDVAVRIAEIRKQQDVEKLFAEAEATFAAGADAAAADAAAVGQYRQLRETNANFKRALVEARLYTLYMRMGRAIVDASPPAVERLPEALDDFTRALALRPRDSATADAQRLASLYLAGREDYDAERWGLAISQLRSVFDYQPSYLGGLSVPPLYDAYIKSGDAYRAANDYAYAYEQYRRAEELPVEDRSLAIARRDGVRPYLTPSPTPSATPTLTPLPTATPYIYNPPTAIPTGTPAPPLATFRNQIVFKSASEEQPGFWVMNPDGSNARYLGSLGSTVLQEQYSAFIEREKLSPDGRYHVYVTTGDSDKSPQLYIQGFEKDQFGNLPTQQVTRQEGLNYDPVWSPDGSRIAFVSTHQGTDDLWVVNPDGTNMWNYTRNKWEWDKHPTWSPDSRKIAFWSNREGTKQIFVIDANGQNLNKIHAVPWDEYDPIWIK